MPSSGLSSHYVTDGDASGGPGGSGGSGGSQHAAVQPRAVLAFHPNSDSIIGVRVSNPNPLTKLQGGDLNSSHSAYGVSTCNDQGKQCTLSQRIINNSIGSRGTLSRSPLDSFPVKEYEEVKNSRAPSGLDTLRDVVQLFEDLDHDFDGALSREATT